MGLFDNLFGKKGLEEKVQTPEPKPEPPKTEASEQPKEEPKKEEIDAYIKRIRITKEYRDKNLATKKIWDYFLKNGQIKKIFGQHSYDHNETLGVVEATLIDGIRYPVSATFNAVIDNSTYFVRLNPSSDSLNVTIECDKEKIEGIEKLLCDIDVKRILIEKVYEKRKYTNKLFKKLQKIAESLSIEPSRYNRPPEMYIGNDGEFYPVTLKLRAKIEGTEYIFEFENLYNEHIKIEFPEKNKDFIKKLLDDIVDDQEEAQKNNEVKSLEFAVPIANYTWEMVGGLGKVRDLIQRDIQWPLENPELFKSMDTKLPKGILMEGPPGTGKTTIAKIIANESKSTFYTISPKDITSMWLGETEKNWGRLFDQARQDAKRGQRAIIFIDEIDGFFTNRQEMDKYTRISFGQFCQEMDGISDLENVVIIAATNNPDILDPALIRPGRFTKRVYIGNPDEQGRREIFGIYAKKKPMGRFDMEQYIKETEGMSGAQIKEIFDAAAFNAIERFSKTKGICIKDIKGDLIKEIRIEQKDMEKSLYAIRNVAYKPKEEGNAN